jgi:hypothetical protein
LLVEVKFFSSTKVNPFAAKKSGVIPAHSRMKLMFSIDVITIEVAEFKWRYPLKLVDETKPSGTVISLKSAGH